MKIRVLTAEERAALVRMERAFPVPAPAKSYVFKLIFIVNPAPLTPKQAAAIEALRQVGWQVVSSHEYFLGGGEWYP